jgi:hypothetical protein
MIFTILPGFAVSELEQGGSIGVGGIGVLAGVAEELKPPVGVGSGQGHMGQKRLGGSFTAGHELGVGHGEWGIGVGLTATAHSLPATWIFSEYGLN